MTSETHWKMPGVALLTLCCCLWLAGCGNDFTGDPEKDWERFAERACDCEGIACLDDLQKDIDRWVRAHEDAVSKLSGEARERHGALMERVAKCSQEARDRAR